MRYVLAGLWVLMLVQSSFGQGEVVPDTLSWQGYYPLEVGNMWEWETEILVAHFGQDQREIITDTLIDGRRYFVQASYFFRSIHGIVSSGRDTTYLRYDTIKTRVVALQENGEEEDYTCDLNADFGTMISCNLFGGETYVDGEYAREDDFLLVGGDHVPFNAAKGYENIGGGINYYHGIGMLPGVGDGSAGTIRFNYLRLSGKEYGERVVFVGVEDEEVPEKTQIELYPNPARDQITLAFEKTGERAFVQVYDTWGRMALSNQECVIQPCRINLSALSSGTYFMCVSNREGSLLVKPFTVIR